MASPYTINQTDQGVTITESTSKTIKVGSLTLDVARLNKEKTLLQQKINDIDAEILLKQSAIDEYNAAINPKK